MTYNGEDMIGDDGYGTHEHHIRTLADLAIIDEEIAALQLRIDAIRLPKCGGDAHRIALHIAKSRASRISEILGNMIVEMEF